MVLQDVGLQKEMELKHRMEEDGDLFTLVIRDMDADDSQSRPTLEHRTD